MALSNTSLSFAQQNNIHAMIITLMYLIPNLVAINALGEYLTKIIDERKLEAPHLLPDLSMHYSDKLTQASQLPHLMVDKLMVTECLRANGIDANVLQLPCPYASGHGASHYAHRHSWVEAGVTKTSGSIGEINSASGASSGILGGHDPDSVSSSPVTGRVSTSGYFRGLSPRLSLILL